MLVKKIDKSTDMEIALFYALHLDNPCGVMVDGKWFNIRYFYEALAKEVLSEMTNPYAKEFLEKKIKKEI